MLSDGGQPAPLSTGLAPELVGGADNTIWLRSFGSKSLVQVRQVAGDAG